MFYTHCRSVAFPPAFSMSDAPAPASAKSALSTVLRVRVDPDLRDRFAAAAAKRDKTPAAVLRGFMASYIDAAHPGALTPPAFTDSPKKRRLSVAIPEFLRDKLNDRAMREQFSASAWIASLVQTNLMQSPVMTDKEMELLHYASRQLAAVGRNLNQIAKHMNQAARMGVYAPSAQDLRMSFLDELRRSVIVQRRGISKLVRARYRAWGGDTNED